MTTHTSGAADLPEALRLADKLNGLCVAEFAWPTLNEAALRLRRYHARVEELEAQVSALAAGQAVAPEGWKLVKQSRLDDIAGYANDPSVPCYRGRNIYDDQKVHQNWEACRSSLSGVKDELQAIREGWDDEELQMSLAVARPAPPAMDGGDAADAARYRWLRDEHARVDPICHLTWKRGLQRDSAEWVNTARLDTAIDAARAAQKEGE